MEMDAFYLEYTSPDAILKYTRATAGAGINSLLDRDYKDVYLQALDLLPVGMNLGPLRMLEFGCGGGMNLLHLVSVLTHYGFNVEHAIGTDLSPVLVEAANKEAQSYLTPHQRSRVQFCVANNETLLEDLSTALGRDSSKLENSFQLIIGVNTIRYCHRAGKQLDCACDIFAFRSSLRNKLRGKKDNEEECYLPSLEEYTMPFQQAGFEVLRSEHFCWIPHSAGRFMTGLLRSLSPFLNTVARSRAMRSLVIVRKPSQS